MQNEKDQQKQENNSASPTMIVEQIDGSYYPFDTSNGAALLKDLIYCHLSVFLFLFFF